SRTSSSGSRRGRLDTGGSRYDVFAGDEQIGLLHHDFRKSLIRTTWRVLDADGQEVAISQERSSAMAVLRRLIDFVPDYGVLIPIPYNFDFLIDGTKVGEMNRKFQL